MKQMMIGSETNNPNLRSYLQQTLYFKRRDHAIFS